MTDTMTSILSRVLSQEIAHQEQWKQKDAEHFKDLPINRDKIIEEIKTFMKDNNIEFSWDWYFSA